MAKSPKISQNPPKFPKISPHDNFFSTNIICDICDKYELWIILNVIREVWFFLMSADNFFIRMTPAARCLRKRILFFAPLPLFCIPATCTLDPNKEGLYQQSWAWSVRNGTGGKQEKLYTDKQWKCKLIFFPLMTMAFVTAQCVMVHLHVQLHSTVGLYYQL